MSDKKLITERINKDIRGVREVRVVGENIESKVMDFFTALKMAEEMGLDLIEISPNANPVVCKIGDYGKLLYEKKQKEKIQKQNNKKMKIKELRFTYNTGDHDFDFKLKHAIKFLEDGNKVKAFVFFSGRENKYIDIGQIMLLKFVDALSEYGKVENMPKLDGKRLWVIINPKK
jgi:translation initiation factor IF-3